MSGHDLYSPSLLAFLDQCLDWSGEKESDAADFGNHIHALIEHIANDKAIEAGADDIFLADRALKWLASLGDLDWRHEQRIEGVVPHTGGTLDAWCFDPVSNRAIIVDWKGSLPPASSMQGKAYALNLWAYLRERDIQPASIVVHFYNYMDGTFVTAEYFSPDALQSDITALIRRHDSQMGNRRAANYGCSYCTHRATCKVAMDTTTTELSIPDELAVMSPQEILTKWEALKAVMKRADKIESAMKERLMESARAGNLPGYTVKSKKSPKQEWRDEAEAMTTVQAILSSHFADAKVTGLLPVSAVKAAVKEALGKSHTKEVEAALMACVQQGSYETLVKAST